MAEAMGALAYSIDQPGDLAGAFETALDVRPARTCST